MVVQDPLGLSGLVVVDKPAGLTSHDVVARLRRILRTRKVGHAGTLDPMATGVLVCGVGRGTKLLGHLALDTKAYTATIRLGAATTTDDAEGEIVTTADPSAVGDDAVADGDRRADGPDPAGAQLGQRDQGRRAAGLRAGAGGGGGGAARRGPSRWRRSRCSPGAAPTSTSPSSARPAPTSGRWPATSVRRWGSAGTSPRCGAPGSDRSASRTPGRCPSWRTRPACPCLWPTPWRPRSPGVDVDAAAAADLSHGRPLPAAGMSGTYGVFAPDGRVLALVAERDGAARPRGGAGAGLRSEAPACARAARLVP